MESTPMAESLARWGHGAQALALLDAALEHGYLTLLAEPRTSIEVTEFAGFPADDLLAALAAHNVVVRKDDKFQLEPQLAADLSDEAPVNLAAKISQAALLARQVADVVRTGSASQSADESLVVARAFALNPSDSARALAGTVLEAIPEARDAISYGRLLDVGSGVGGFVLTAATLLPGMRATALELLPELAAIAAQRAREFGVADRVDIRAVDAGDFEAPSGFDAAFWAQPFFPDPSRRGVLAMILRNLRPGGILLVQQLHDQPATDSDRPAFSLLGLVAQAQGMPFARPLAEVVAECEAAGFELIRTLQIDLGRFAVLRRP